MVDHLSASSVKSWLRCGKAWEYRYVKGLKIPPSGVMIAGSAYHEALADYFNAKLDGVDEMTVNDVADAYDTAFERLVSDQKAVDEDEGDAEGTVDWGGQDRGKLKDSGIELVKLYRASIALKIVPVSVELSEIIQVADKPFMVIRDLVTETKIIDHKLKAKRFYPADLANDIQPTAYLYGKPEHLFEYHVALKQVNPSIECQSTIRTKSDFSLFEQIVQNVWKAVESGIFPPRPDNNWACSPTWCGYWGLCRK